MNHQIPSSKLQRGYKLQAPSLVAEQPCFDFRSLVLGISLVLGAWCLGFQASAQPTNGTSPIDLPTALRLAGAQNLDVQIAREKVREARANRQGAVAQFFPWISAGITYRQHDDTIQDVQGNLVHVDKYSYAPGGALNAQVDFGEAWFKSLATKQLAHAAQHALESQRQETVCVAAKGYFDLALAQGAAGVAAEALRISGDYENQISRAVEAGLAFKGDALRARVQKERNELALRQAREQQRIAAAKLAQTLRLDPSVEIVVPELELAPLNLVSNTALSSLVAQALGANQELKQGVALSNAARDARAGAKYGPLIPTLSGQAFFGGLGGGREGIASSYGGQQDYFVGATWRIGPGGLFDFTRIKASDARVKASALGYEKLKDDLTRQLVEAVTRAESQADQLATTRRALSATEEGWRLAQQRKEFAVGVVLETIQAEQEFTRARLDYLKALSAFNSAQYDLARLTGGL